MSSYCARGSVRRFHWPPSRDLAISPATLKRYLEVLQALYIVFTVQPWRHNVGRAILQTPKVYFFDTGLVRGDGGVRLENAVAAMLLKHVHFRQDARGKPANLHYIRTKDGAEVDFALSDDRELTHLIECRLSDSSVHRALAGFANKFPGAEAIQPIFLRWLHLITTKTVYSCGFRGVFPNCATVPFG